MRRGFSTTPRFRHATVVRGGPGGLRRDRWRTVAGPVPGQVPGPAASPVGEIRLAARRLGTIGALPAGHEAAPAGAVRGYRWSPARAELADPRRRHGPA